MLDEASPYNDNPRAASLLPLATEQSMLQITRILLPSLIAFSAIAINANEPQSFTANVDGASFAGDDDTILFVPLPSGAFSLGVSTAGATAYPPPKTPVDEISIVCEGFTPGKTLKLDNKALSSASCDATFKRGADGTRFSLDKDNPANQFEISSSHGKVIEGSVELHLKNPAGKSMTISNGRFVAEDRQI
jgi:hypothetical protein